jgi:hypothetical protein
MKKVRLILLSALLCLREALHIDFELVRLPLGVLLLVRRKRSAASRSPRARVASTEWPPHRCHRRKLHRRTAPMEGVSRRAR